MKPENLKSSYPLLTKTGLSTHSTKAFTVSLTTNNKKTPLFTHLFTSSAKHPPVPVWMAICFFITGMVLAIHILH